MEGESISIRLQKCKILLMTNNNTAFKAFCESEKTQITTIMTEQEMKKRFMTDLVSKYGYPKESVKSEVRIGSHVFDVAIQKGTVYIQVFEFKKKHTREISFIYQRFSEASVETPFYSVIFKDDGSWNIYEGDDVKNPIQNVKEVLNYQKAIAKFFHDAQHDIGRVIKGLKIKCRTCACVLMLYFALYLICGGACQCCCNHAANIPDLLSYDIILYLCLIIILVLLPSLLQLIRVVRKIKIGLFELELADKLDI